MVKSIKYGSIIFRNSMALGSVQKGWAPMGGELERLKAKPISFLSGTGTQWLCFTPAGCCSVKLFSSV